MMQFPVATVNTELAKAAYTSFEAEAKGNWTYSGYVTADNTSPTGVNCYSLSGSNITKSGLASATYIVSYWSKSGSAFTVNNSSTPTRTGKTINGWTYYEHEITSTSITISGAIILMKCVFIHKGTQMTSYTYNPLIGMTSQCDADNKINYYEYDSFGRLRLIKDQDKNIIKVFDYQYNQPQNQ
ncbi:MAG: hypothetical protein IPO53_11805 [Chitinophagaceae bacterium]|nr:hypothetical protein [Chitinophagaceae bacterium]